MAIPLKELCEWGVSMLKGDEGKFYRENPAAYEHIVVAHARRSVAAAVCRLTAQQFEQGESPQVILDTACGTGLMTNALAEQFPSAQVYGVDVSQPSLDYAASTKADGIHWVNGSFEDLSSFSDGSVDLYTMLAAYRHIQDRGAFFSEIDRVLSDRGVAVVPKMDMWWFQMLKARKLATEAGLDASVQRLRGHNILLRPFINKALVMRKSLE
jgi:trans-aconitate methyltransferase